ncbi:MAG TPA: hypothetical protein VN662_02930 [Rhodanobacteraceae bacterium]|nr:hypothetical protein [Rhodanobacteraceae bacterium]
MDAILVGTVGHAVQLPGIENPAFACPHVDMSVGAEELNGRIGRHGDVHPNPFIPVMVGIDVGGYLCAGCEAHQPHASQHNAQTAEHLAQIGAAFQGRRRPHRAGQCIAARRIALDGNQWQCRIARQTAGMGLPQSFPQCLNFGGQRARIEKQWQLDEGNRQLHRKASWPASAGSRCSSVNGRS